MKNQLLIIVFAIFHFTFLYSQDEKYEFSYAVYFLPTAKKISGKKTLNKRENKELEQLISSDSLKIQFSEEEFADFIKVFHQLSTEKQHIKKCEKQIFQEVKNKILKLSFHIDEGKSSDSLGLNETIVIIDGTRFKLNFIDSKENIISYSDDYFNKPFFKRIKEFYIFYNFINSSNSKAIQKFGKYFSSENLYRLIIELIVYNNCK